LCKRQKWLRKRLAWLHGRRVNPAGVRALHGWGKARYEAAGFFFLDATSGLLATRRRFGDWPLPDIVITNIGWCTAYQREVEGGSYISQYSRAIVMQHCGQYRQAGRMKGRLNRAQTTRSKTLFCEGQFGAGPVPLCAQLVWSESQDMRKQINARKRRTHEMEALHDAILAQVGPTPS